MRTTRCGGAVPGIVIVIVPRPLDAVLPTYMWRFAPNGQFDRQTA